MLLNLSNQFLKVKVNTKGAELNSIQNEDHIEYIWQADADYWGRHAPILFPIVGRLKDNNFKFNGNDYHMTQHGFARDLEFQVVKQAEDRVILELQSNAKTKEIYPFDFKLQVQYRLEGHSVKTNLNVQNVSDQTMWFSIGAHPGFNVPVQKDENTKFTDYHLTVSPKKQYTKIPLKDSLSDPDHASEVDLSKPLTMHRELFKNDAQAFKLNGKETTLMLSTDKNDHGIALTLDNAPLVGVWSPYPKDAPLVSIEPWWGIADNVNHNGELTRKDGINQLAAHQEFNANFNITVF